MSARTLRLAGTLAAIAAFGAPASADEQQAAYLAGTCGTCHHAGAPGSAIPALAGREAAELIAALQAYRDGTRPDALMHAIATSLSDAETTEVATYLAHQEVTP